MHPRDSQSVKQGSSAQQTIYVDPTGYALSSPPATEAMSDETCSERFLNNHQDFRNAARLATQPAEAVCAGCCSLICCCLSFCGDNKPATKNDISRAQIAARQGQTLQQYETKQAAEAGVSCGMAVVRCPVTILSCTVGLFAASYRSACSSTPRKDGAFGYSRKELDETPQCCDTPGFK